MSAWDTAVKVEAWERLVSGYRELQEDGYHTDAQVADLTRQIVAEVEG